MASNGLYIYSIQYGRNIDDFDNTTLTILIIITTNIEILLWYGSNKFTG